MRAGLLLLAASALLATARPAGPAVAETRAGPPAPTTSTQPARAVGPKASFVDLYPSIGRPGTDPDAPQQDGPALDDLYLPLLAPRGEAAGAAYHWGPGTVPQLASSVTHSHGTYTITLRRGVRDCAGDELTAADVVFALRRAGQVSLPAGLQAWSAWNAAGMLGAPVHMVQAAASGATGQSPPGTGAAGRSPVATAVAPITGGIRILGRYVLQLHPDPDNGMLPTVLADVAAAPIDAALVARLGGRADPFGLAALATHDAGFGPYCLASFRPGHEIVLRANPYWTLSPRPALRTVVLKQVASLSRRIADVAAGRAQAAEDVGSSVPASLERSGRVSLLSDTASTDHLQLDFGFAGAPFGPNGAPRALLMREAVAAAIPYAAVVRAVGGAPDGGFVPPAIPGAVGAGAQLRTDVALAATDLAAAGHAKGIGLPSPTITLAFDASDPRLGGVAKLIATSLAAIGLQVTLDPITGPAPGASGASGASGAPASGPQPPLATESSRFAMSLVTGGTTFPDAAWYVQRWYAAPSLGGALDGNGYLDPALDSLVARAAAASGSARRSLAAAEQNLLAADVPVVPLAILPSDVLVGRGVRAMSVGGPGAFYAVTSLGP